MTYYSIYDIIQKVCKVKILYKKKPANKVVNKVEKIVRQSMLYDFYGELLTEHQKSIYQDVIVNDLSYTEIAGLYGISRQGVYDMIKRCDKIMEEYEDKLRLVDRFLRAKEMAGDIQKSILKIRELNNNSDLDSYIKIIEDKTSELLDEF